MVIIISSERLRDIVALEIVNTEKRQFFLLLAGLDIFSDNAEMKLRTEIGDV